MSLSIDLGNYRTDGVRVFAGRDRGKEVRSATDLDALETAEQEIVVHVPKDVFSVNSSFFLAMFGPSVRKFGEREFRRRFRFTGKNIQRVIDDGIREAITREGPF